MLQEFNRIEGTSSLSTLLEDGMNKYMDALLRQSKSIKKRPKVLEEALADIALQKEMAARKGMENLYLWKITISCYKKYRWQ